MPTRHQPYHHGDLHAALLEAALAATRTGGPAALSMREVTRAVGVSPAAAYRHFGGRAQLLRAVSLAIQERMAATMQHRMRAPRTASPPERALLRLRGVGLGYVTFALDEPGWFTTAFFGDARGRPGDDVAASATPPPFALLTAALDECLAADALPADRRQGAEFACWSAVHGCAELLIHGPLRDADRPTQMGITEQVVDAIIAGVRGP